MKRTILMKAMPVSVGAVMALGVFFCGSRVSWGDGVDPSLIRRREELAVIAEELRGESLRLKGNVGQMVRQLQDRIENIKRSPQRTSALIAVLDHLKTLVTQYPARSYGREHPRSTTRAIARQLTVTADRAVSADDLSRRLLTDLILPPDDEASLERILPVNMTLEDFKKKGPILIFIMKHRLSVPDSYDPIEPENLMDGRYNVGVGVLMRGRVSDAHYFAGDGDFVFNIVPIHCEITPGWRAKYQRIRGRAMTQPKDGDLVEIRGWTYYDLFHEDESSEERELTEGRPTVWEIHPVTEVTVLKSSSQKKRR
ncbi:MAG: hypothetical protein AAB091_01880 [Elusimicrobiota bacterium]